jgi:hypothetical protein
MWPGFLHPLIHLGFGVEFKQPAIIAEALAQTAIHETWMGSFFFESEKVAEANGADPKNTKTVVQLLDEIRADKKLSSAAHWDDGNKVRDGILKRAPDEMLKYASQYVVSESQLEEKTAEMVNATGEPPTRPVSLLNQPSQQSTKLTRNRSVLHSSSPAPTTSDQIRFLLHPLCE